jgi:hypothetical protein
MHGFSFHGYSMDGGEAGARHSADIVLAISCRHTGKAES